METRPGRAGGQRNGADRSHGSGITRRALKAASGAGRGQYSDCQDPRVRRGSGHGATLVHPGGELPIVLHSYIIAKNNFQDQPLLRRVAWT